MNYDLKILEPPQPFQPGTITLWSNEYIAGNALKKHLDGQIDSGSRKTTTIDLSAKWIVSNSVAYPDILDIGCGPGLYGNQLSKMVRSYDGIDISQYQVAYANSHNTAKGNAHYEVCDFRKWIPLKHYDTVLLLYAIYSFYCYEERINLLKKIKNVLNPNGSIIVEVFTPEHYVGRNNSTDWQYVENGGFWSPNSYLELNAFSRYNKRLVLIQAGIIDKEINIWNSWIQLFDVAQIEKELKLAGFSEFSYYGSCYGECFTSRSEVLCVCAK